MLKIVYLPIETIRWYEKNPKAHPKSQIDKIANSIKEFGFNIPILIDKNNVIIAGHGRLLASKQLELKEVPTICIENLTEAQIKAFRIADNKVTESDWEYDFLSQEILDLKQENYNLSLLGFSEIEIEQLSNIEEPKEKEYNENIEVTNMCPKCGYKW